MRQLTVYLAAVFVLILTAANSAAQKNDLARFKAVKEAKGRIACNSYEGVVQEIDENLLTLYGKFDGHTQHRSRVFAPIDVLRKGEVFENSFPGFAYRWKDVKKGDTIHIDGADDGFGGWFCLAISIRRRPGETLPKSQESKNDTWYDTHRVYNDIENGLDVTEEEIWKTWPTVSIADPEGGVYRPGGPDAMLANYRMMLLENRKRIAEEKEKGLKAKSADGKSDPKKDDKK